MDNSASNDVSPLSDVELLVRKIKLELSEIILAHAHLSIPKSQQCVSATYREEVLQKLAQRVAAIKEMAQDEAILISLRRKQIDGYWRLYKANNKYGLSHERFIRHQVG